MPAQNTYLTVEQGATYAHGWLVTYNGEPIDDTWSARGQVRRTKQAETTLLEFDCDVASNGVVSVRIPAEITTELDFWRAVYDVEAVNSDESVILRVAEGIIELDKEVTRDA